MQKQITVGILGEERVCNRQILAVFSDKILDLILSYDAVPLGILPPNIHAEAILSDNEKQKLYHMLDLCDGVVLQGGYNIFNYQLDAVRYIKEKNIPVLGICLGMQVMALASNGVRKAIIDNSHRQRRKNAHKIIIDKDSKLYNIMKKDEMMVNSRHFCLVEGFDDYIVSAKSSNDNVVEAIELPDKLFHIGVQWHPENLYTTNPNVKNLLNAFFGSCHKFKER